MTPTLSQIQNWDVEHLSQAGTFWRNTAEVWDSAFTRVHREIRSPRQTTWIGAGADAALVRLERDHATVCVAVQKLIDAATSATASAENLAAAQKSVLLAVGEAEAEGFSVGEDLSVTARDATAMFPAEFYARTAQAESFAVLIQKRVFALLTLDAETGRQISSAAEHLKAVLALRASPNSEVDRTSSIQLIDNRTFVEGPVYPEPGIEPGTGGPGPIATAGAIREAVKDLPSGTRSNYLEVRDQEQLRRFADWVTRGATDYQSPNPYRGGQPMYQLPDGTVVSQGASVKHGLTMDIKLADGTKFKIHVNSATGGEINMPRAMAAAPVRPPQVRVPEPLLRPGLPLVGPPQFVDPGGPGAPPSVLPAVPPLIDSSEP